MKAKVINQMKRIWNYILDREEYVITDKDKLYAHSLDLAFLDT